MPDVNGYEVPESRLCRRHRKAKDGGKDDGTESVIIIRRAKRRKNGVRKAVTRARKKDIFMVAGKYSSLAIFRCGYFSIGVGRERIGSRVVSTP